MGNHNYLTEEKKNALLVPKNSSLSVNLKYFFSSTFFSANFSYDLTFVDSAIIFVNFVLLSETCQELSRKLSSQDFVKLPVRHRKINKLLMSTWVSRIINTIERLTPFSVHSQVLLDSIMNYFDQDFEDILEIVRREMGENAVVPVSQFLNLKYIQA